MESKVSEWRPGPTVCRCCLSEGCYKDISTEYFWMGKREVYAEMLSETLDLSISYSASGGPNSNSRLICENCIARLRDATDFKRQVQECEKTFIQHIDGGANITDAEVQVESAYSKPVKVEDVKLEKRGSDDDFDDRGDFLGADDDDDDLDDQPLTKIASRTPKKETVDILDLLDNAKAAEKRKSTTKTKTPPAKKLKKKEPLPKPSASKTLSSDKKKKGERTETIVIKNEELNSEAAASTRIDRYLDGKITKRNIRRSLETIIEYTTACLFKWCRGIYLCYFCSDTFLDPRELRDHVSKETKSSKDVRNEREYVKVDFSESTCKKCGLLIDGFDVTKRHLSEKHRVNIIGTGILPYKLNDKEFVCQICGMRYELFMTLNKHMNSHFQDYTCIDCGKSFATSRRLHSHRVTHEQKEFTCSKCDATFPDSKTLYSHISRIHRLNERYKCPICSEKFVSYSNRLNHLIKVHNRKTVQFPCPSCPRVFKLCSQRTAHVKQRHLEERNYLCNVCGSKFPAKYRLSQHMIKHSAQKKYQCDVCKKFYARMNTLREHMRIHNNDRRFKCEFCGQAFVQKCSLKQHLKTHHSGCAKVELQA